MLDGNRWRQRGSWTRVEVENSSKKEQGKDMKSKKGIEKYD